MPTAVTAKTLPDAMKTGTVIVDLWAPWCGPCKILSPILAQIETELPLRVVTLNVDDDKTVAAQYQVQSIPTMLVFQDGKAVEKITGAYPKAKLKQHFTQVLEQAHGGK